MGGSKKKPVMNNKIVAPVPQAGQTQNDPIAAVPTPDTAALSAEAEKERLMALKAKGRQANINTSNAGDTSGANISIKKLTGS
jgi:hypothetical protein